MKSVQIWKITARTKYTSVYISYHFRTNLPFVSYVTYLEACFLQPVCNFCATKVSRAEKYVNLLHTFITEHEPSQILPCILSLFPVLDRLDSLTVCAPWLKPINNTVTVSRCCLLSPQSQKKLWKSRLLHWNWRCKFWIDHAGFFKLPSNIFY